ncbi:RtcB family protein [Gimesia sp.]|uniref:RtcB family protein n=1 Tax=Gimesia sp. TaxID=2024833 RepID=UPI0032EC1324
MISPGGVGYDINCGVRLIRSNLFHEDVKPYLPALIEELFQRVPCGVGRTGKYHFSNQELCQMMEHGPAWFKEQRGMVTEHDIAHTEAHGCLSGARPELVSERALLRGVEQCGTLGSGNHFLEAQLVDMQIVNVMIHSGFRGLGYQICDDALKALRVVPQKYGIHLPDRQLTYAPVLSPEGEHYLGAMQAATNYAWCNRQLLMHQAREVFETVFGFSWQELGMTLIYDIALNIAKLEEHTVDGSRKQVWVHRKGATRTFPAGHPEVPEQYQEIGQSIRIPSDMGRASWALVGQPGCMEQTFGTTCICAGRQMSRKQAVRVSQGRDIDEELRTRGVIARARSWRGLAEEQPCCLS